MNTSFGHFLNCDVTAVSQVLEPLHDVPASELIIFSHEVFKRLIGYQIFGLQPERETSFMGRFIDAC
ncbi:hypothetical protein HOO54_12810 [Bacillus sp. WMMC1349]|uniref:hypothetical protein n=1 Tax=Bacillus sp. WMMC1349 TaxID=2736254 RepID=UPI0015573BD3|nr:hypothetical protein [Bacillus sp. WMMC1349]NPC93086.1 hypothetical protein [Bacillus sp. WMMC1349]